MKLRVFILALAASLCLLPVSCAEQDPEDNTAAITPRTTELEARGGSIFVSVTARAGWHISYETSDEGTWASLSPVSGEGSKADVRLYYDANEGDQPRSIVLVLHPAKGPEVRSETLVQKSMFYASGDSYGEDVASPKWLELPATVAGDGLDFFAHDMAGGAYVSQAVSGVRNWSFYWDYKEHMSLWVAYPLNNSLKGNGNRTNVWGLDPLLPADIQPNLIMGSYGGGWTRGHQIPSADRLTREANISTFYGTNMTPQDYNFNAGVWADLEGKVRSYASAADTLYVVTGCQYKDSATHSGNSSGFMVRIPTHYFKALLYKGPSTYATDGYMAAGFFLPHDTSISKASCLNYIRSIDTLEKETGIDFFPNLVALIGKDKADALEAAEPSKWWK